MDFTWKCFVFPGVEPTETCLRPIKALMVELFPTLGYPTSPTVNFSLSTRPPHAVKRSGKKITTNLEIIPFLNSKAPFPFLLHLQPWSLHLPRLPYPN